MRARVVWTMLSSACYIQPRAGRTISSPANSIQDRLKVQLFQMPSRTQHGARTFALCLLLTLLCCAAPALAQDEDFGEDAPDPVKLLRRGQAAHARGVQNKSKEDLQAALEFYEQAIRLNPEFAEAEYQKGAVLGALGRGAEAEKSFRRAMELSPEWLLPPAALSQLLARAPGREREAEEVLRSAVKLDPSNAPLLFALAELRRRAGDSTGALELLRRATDEGDSPSAAMWLARAEMEQAGRDTASALQSLGRALKLEPENTFARFRRAEVYFETKDTERALQDLRALEGAAKADAGIALSVASLYARAGDKASALRVIDSLPDAARRSPDAERLRSSLVAVNCDPSPEARDALEKLLSSEPNNAPLHACLGELHRTSDPPRALEHFRRAAEIERTNVKYATGYASALIQLRRFDEAASLLRRVVSAAPDDYVARANYATALYELKLYRQALDEYAWMSKARPELAVIQYFVGTAHDRLGEYEEALRAYETFLARADARANQLEIDKVNLRLPSLRNQIKRGEGVKRKVGR